MGHHFYLVTGLVVFSTLGLALGEITNGKNTDSYFQNDNDTKEKSMEYTPGEVVWEEIAKAVFCGTDGNDQDKANAIRNILKAYDSKSNWIIFVTPLEAKSAWSFPGWEILDKRDLCEKNLLVFQRPSIDLDCVYNIKEDIMALIHPASTEAADCITVRDVIRKKELMFNLDHQIIFTFTSGSWASRDYSACHNYDNSGNVSVFYYGFSTQWQQGQNEIELMDDNNTY